ncbi:hypothetical protein 7865G3C4_23 [Haloquadratum phage sp.]|nr:hypothetical protein 7865G3C4_23 [Haloquadratum phage sp.]
MATWELFRDGTKEQDLINVQYIDSANPFGDYVILQIEDNLGQKFDKFPYATEVEVTVTPEGGSQISKFVGFVVERRENDQQGQDVLEVEAYSFDQFLRQNDVSNDQSGKLISDAIEDIVKTDTPVSFNAAEVNVVDDFELRRSLQDERVETALQILSFESGNEGFGVDDTLEFFFRPRERDTIARGIDNTEWFNYDIPERGKEAINEVEVRFDNGNRSVVVDNPSQKLEIQNSLNLPDPATQRARIARPEITNAQDAESEGRRFLKLKNVTLTGTITTFGLFNAEPLDTINAEIIPRGIDSEFVITQIEYNWGRDETTLTIVENRGFDEDLFVRLSEKTERIDLRDSDPQAVEDRVISADVAADVITVITAAGQTLRATTTNDAVDIIVSGWTGNGNPTVSDIVVGDKATELSRSDSDLENQISSVSATESIPTNKLVQYSAQITQNNVKEVGLKDQSGTLISRGIFESSVNLSGNITISIFIQDSTESNGVVTDTGQNAIRDIIADNNPQIPTRYAFGDNQTQPTTSDTSLTNRVQSTNLNRSQLQDIDTPSEFESSVSIADDKPVSIDQLNGAVELEPVTYYTEAENADFVGSFFQSTTTLSNDDGVNIKSFGDFVEFTFTVNQDIPAGKLRAGTYAELDNWDGTVEYSFDGDVYRTVNRTGVTGQNLVEGFSGTITLNSTKLEAGTTHTIRAETTQISSGTGSSHIIDVMYAFDDRNVFDIQAPASSAFNGDTYDFPELFPKEASVSFSELSSRRELTELELVQTWNDTSNNTSVSLNLGSQSNTVNNPTLNPNGRIRETLTVSASNASRTGSIDITLSRFNNTSTSSTVPRLGDGTQRMSFHIVDGDPDAVTRSNIGEATTRAFFQSGFLTGNILREAGQKSGGDLLTHSIFADVIPDNDNIIASEQIQFIPK